MSLFSRIARLVPIVSFLFVCGCATLLPRPAVEPEKIREADQLRAHHILVHEDGYPFHIVHGTLWDSREASSYEQYLARIGNILDGVARRAAEAADQKQPLRILLFAHGGLNSYRGEGVRGQI